MGIGIASGIGPLRVGISTRGIGGGIGPIRAGTGWRRRRSSGSADAGWSMLFGFAIVVTAAYLVVAWPWLLGTWLAVELGAGHASTSREVAGWVFAGVYLTALDAAAIRHRRRSAPRLTPAAENRVQGLTQAEAQHADDRDQIVEASVA
jgi:hypothetical protein